MSFASTIYKIQCESPLSSTLARIPVFYSEDDSEWLIDATHDYNYMRCSCHDLLWHYRTLNMDYMDYTYCPLSEAPEWVW